MEKIWNYEIQCMNSLFLKKVRTEADIYKIPRIRDEGFDFIKSQIKGHKIESILEIGSGNGYSTLLYYTLPDVRNILTFEYNPTRYNLARHNLKENKNIRILNQDFLEYFESGERFDLIFIDGMKRKYIDFLNILLGFLSIQRSLYQIISTLPVLIKKIQYLKTSEYCQKSYRV